MGSCLRAGTVDRRAGGTVRRASVGTQSVVVGSVGRERATEDVLGVSEARVGDEGGEGTYTTEAGIRTRKLRLE